MIYCSAIHILAAHFLTTERDLNHCFDMEGSRNNFKDSEKGAVPWDARGQFKTFRWHPGQMFQVRETHVTLIVILL